MERKDFSLPLVGKAWLRKHSIIVIVIVFAKDFPFSKLFFFFHSSHNWYKFHFSVDIAYPLELSAAGKNLEPSRSLRVSLVYFSQLPTQSPLPHICMRPYYSYREHIFTIHYTVAHPPHQYSFLLLFCLCCRNLYHFKCPSQVQLV